MNGESILSSEVAFFLRKCCSLDARHSLGKPECGRLILETLSLSLHSGPCEQFQGFTPRWASMIGPLKKRSVEVAEGSRSLTAFLPKLPLSTSPPGPPRCVLPSRDRPAGGHPERMLLRWAPRNLVPRMGLGRR